MALSTKKQCRLVERYSYLMLDRIQLDWAPLLQTADWLDRKRVWMGSAFLVQTLLYGLTMLKTTTG